MQMYHVRQKDTLKFVRIANIKALAMRLSPIGYTSAQTNGDGSAQ